ncbi:hypothetical protein [Paenibacillus ehimensis]|uniref:hypothetical protein n=1 Tax=Paenibacillus ehimensis TaxID=79264 RepID=UPI00046E9826|nr:hypothetical protein [Paenibacillus ehimensis]
MGDVAIIPYETYEQLKREKIILPRGIAKAIEFLREENVEDWEIFVNSINYNGYVTSSCKMRRSLAIYCRSTSPESIKKLMSALVNGYEIEPLTVDEIRNRITEIVNEWHKGGADVNDFECRKELAGQIGGYLGSLTTE